MPGYMLIFSYARYGAKVVGSREGGCADGGPEGNSQLRNSLTHIINIRERLCSFAQNLSPIHTRLVGTALGLVTVWQCFGSVDCSNVPIGSTSVCLSQTDAIVDTVRDTLKSIESGAEIDKKFADTLKKRKLISPMYALDPARLHSRLAPVANNATTHRQFWAVNWLRGAACGRLKGAKFTPASKESGET
eukprot:9013573-Pyramimonas_sp.AAC.2